MSPEAEQLRQALRDPAAFVENEVVARASYVARRHFLDKIGKTLATAELPAVLVKGAGLALTHYPKPWQREMTDIDLLVRRDDCQRVVDALTANGWRVLPLHKGRRWSASALGEIGLVPDSGVLAVLLEVHTQLDKIIRRPVDYEGIIKRAEPVAGLAGLSVPSAEDHALLVVLHAACAEFRHPLGVIDLERLWSSGLDLGKVQRRAERWQLCTALFVLLSMLRELGSASVSEVDVERFRPGFLRRRLAGLLYQTANGACSGDPPRAGLAWILRQGLLYDRTSTWAAGVSSYAMKRVAERALSRFGLGFGGDLR